MAKRDEEVQKVEELPPRIHISEFVNLYTTLDEMQKAGFKAHCKKEWMRKEEWQYFLTEYLK
jgi:hypothetical protein